MNSPARSADAVPSPASPAIADEAGFSPWNPGVGVAIPDEFRPLESIFRDENVVSTIGAIEDFVGLTGLPAEQLVVFRPRRLALHELIVRVTADVAVAEGDEEEDFGHNFRRIAGVLWDRDIAPRLDQIEDRYAAVRAELAALVPRLLDQTLFAAPPPPPPRGFWRRWLARAAPAAAAPSLSPAEREHAAIEAYKTEGLRCQDPVRRAALRSLYRVFGAMIAKHGRLVGNRELLARPVIDHACNAHAALEIGHLIGPWLDAGIAREGFARTINRAAPLLVSLKGASAAGKSSLRPLIKQIMRDQDIESEGYATISPDVWRRLLLDYASLGPARKYAGHLTSRELMVVDGKLDRYIRYKAHRDQAIPHFLVDRFRFDSFASEKVGRILHDTYARYVDRMFMYFIVTPPEKTVERGWQRALERGRYKAVEDFLGHSVEAYTGMPKLLFKWLAHPRPAFHYFFLDNDVPRGTFPKTIAYGDQRSMTVVDPLGLVNIERFQKIEINATSPEQLYPPARQLAVAANCAFLGEIVRRLPEVIFVEPETGTPYCVVRGGKAELGDADAWSRRMADADLRELFSAIFAAGVGGRAGAS